MTLQNFASLQSESSSTHQEKRKNTHLSSESAFVKMNSNIRNTSPFTATQRQELEHHALIFKYMVSGVPIPSDLIYTVKRSLDSSFSASLFPHQPSGWGRFQMSFGRKVDPEPGRCRRTDGKKWRCSKEAYPESKYCERHMHRGRNRSRKHVEITSTKTKVETTNLSPSSISPFNSTNIFPTAASSRARTIMTSMDSEYQAQNTHLYRFLQPPSSSFRPPGSGLFLNSQSYSETDTDYRHLQGMREGVDEQAFFPLTMNSYRDCSQSQFQSLTTDHSKQKQKEPHCFMLGNNLKQARPIDLEKENETKQPLRQFFGGWTPKSSDSWLDLASNSTLNTDD